MVVVVGDQAESEKWGLGEIIRHICKRGIVRFFFFLRPSSFPVLPPTPRFPIRVSAYTLE